MSGVRTRAKLLHRGKEDGWQWIERVAENAAMERAVWRLFDSKKSFEAWHFHTWRVLNLPYRGQYTDNYGSTIYGEGTVFVACSAVKRPWRRLRPQRKFRFGTTEKGQWITPGRISKAYKRNYYVQKNYRWQEIDEYEALVLAGRFPTIYSALGKQKFDAEFERLIRTIQHRHEAENQTRRVAYGGMYDQDGHTVRFKDSRNKWAKPKSLREVIDIAERWLRAVDPRHPQYDGGRSLRPEDMSLKNLGDSNSGIDQDARLATTPLEGDESDGENYTTEEKLRPTEAAIEDE